jgi:hypothetical protein
MMAEVIARADADGKPVAPGLVGDEPGLFLAVHAARVRAADGLPRHALSVPGGGLPGVTVDPRVRPATPADVPAMATLERELVGIERAGDYRYFLDNAEGIWHASVLPSADGAGLDGFLVSVAHPASNLLGPGVARTEESAAALVVAELDHHRGRTPVFLVPVQAASLVQQMYALGAKNCELHFAQVRGRWTEPLGVVLPTFMPETG